MSRFDGHRMYNGCPDSTMKKRWDYLDSLERKMKKICPVAFITYFPAEAKWDVGVSEPWGRWTRHYESVIPELMSSKEVALKAAIKLLTESKMIDE